MNELGARVVDEARKLLGTPWHHQGRVAGMGLDCVGVVIIAGKRAGAALEDVHGYRLPCDSTHLIDEIERQTDKVGTYIEQSEPGDLAVFWTTRPDRPKHFGVITSPLTMVTIVADEFVVERVIQTAEFDHVYDVRRMREAMVD